MKKTFFLALFGLAVSGRAQTTVPANILSDTTWTPSGNPYIVSGTTIIWGSAKLTIDPGVIVKFNSGASLEVRGKLHAIGNATDSIEFTSNLASPTMGSWNGLKVVWTGSPSVAGNQVKLDYVKGMYAYHFIDMNLAYDGPYTFRHCRFAYNVKTNHDGGMPSAIWEYCKFDHNNTSLDACQFYDRVSNSEFVNNIDGAMGMENTDSCIFKYNSGIALSPYGSCIGNTLSDNYIAVQCYFNAVNNNFINNIITNNYSGVEIKTYFNGSIAFTGNIICNNSTYNIKMLAPFSTNDADLSGNCFCGNDSVAIQSKIYDKNNDVSLGLVTFLPLGTFCDTVTLGLSNEASQKGLVASVYPNPFNARITIKLNDGTGTANFSLYDATARMVIEKNFSNSVIVDAQELCPGPYIYILKDKNGQFAMGKLIKN